MNHYAYDHRRVLQESNLHKILHSMESKSSRQTCHSTGKGAGEPLWPLTPQIDRAFHSTCDIELSDLRHGG